MICQARQKKKIEKMVEKGVDPSKVLVMHDFLESDSLFKVEAKKARMEAGRARHEQRCIIISWTVTLTHLVMQAQ